MLKRLGLLTAFFMLLLHNCIAANHPAVLKNATPYFNDSAQQLLSDKTREPRFLVSLKKAVAAKLLRYQLRHAAVQKSKSTLSLISLIAGVLGLACLASIVLAPAGLLLAPTAVITGIVALHHNKDKGARTQAIIGLIAGALPIVFIIIAAIIFANGGFWVE